MFCFCKFRNLAFNIFQERSCTANCHESKCSGKLNCIHIFPFAFFIATYHYLVGYASISKACKGDAFSSLIWLIAKKRKRKKKDNKTNRD